MKGLKQKPPRFFEWLMRIFFPDNGMYSTVGDMHEQYTFIAESEGKSKAGWWYRYQVIKSLLPIPFHKLVWNLTMFRSYMKVALRNFQRQKLFTFINVSGLAIGIATCIIIGLWVQNELSYDQFHKNADRIFRVEREITRDEIDGRWPITSAKYKQALIDDYPEVIDAARFWRRTFSIKDSNGDLRRETLFAVDNSVFNIFDFEFLHGSKETALDRPKTIVLTQDAAIRYFGSFDIIGNTLELEWQGEYTPFEITGLLKDLPENSHISFEMLMSFNTYPKEAFTSWRSNYLHTYVLLDEVAQLDKINEKLKGFIDNRLEPEYGDLIVQGRSIHDVLKLYLFPITGIHLNPSENYELQAGGSFQSVVIFSSVGLLILIIAGINFINLSTARANRRAKEVCLRKTLGAYKKQLKIQFLQESLLLTVVASCLGILITLAFISFYDSIFSNQFPAVRFFSGYDILLFSGIVFTIGLIAGLYPAMQLSKFEPAQTIKGQFQSTGKKSNFRRNMVVFQFSISITLLIGMTIMYQQMSFINTKEIGFEKENVVLLPSRSSIVADRLETFKTKLLANSEIISASGSADLPGDAAYSNGNLHSHEGVGTHFSSILLNCDYDFIETYKIPFLAGRNFSRNLSTDTLGTIILNETAVGKLGYKPNEAIGKLLDRGDANNSLKIIGVVKDFNFQSLQYNIEPAAFMLSTEYITAISVRIAPGDIVKSLKLIEDAWESTFAGELFEHSFLDERLQMLYISERQTQTIIIIFSAMSVLVACLGLFGLAAFTAEERTKEIGIRKTLGATIANIFSHLTKDYLKWVLISAVIAWPVSYYLMTSWLQNFAYRISLNVWPFVLSVFTALIISLITVSYQSLKAAGANPLDSIKYE